MSSLRDLIPPFHYRLRAQETLITVEDFRRAARRRLPRMIWTFVDGGAEDLSTVAANRDAFARWALHQRALAGHAERSLATTVAGVPLSMPVLLAPTGLSGLTHWEGDVAAARAAERAGTRHLLSTAASWSIEEVARSTVQDHFFQLYPREGRKGAELMRRAAAAGMRVMCVTVDVPVRGNREGERREGMDQPPVITPRRALNVLTRPRWLYDIARHQRIAARNLVDDGGLGAALRSLDAQEREFMQSRLSWDDLAWMREHWEGPLFVKGILGAADAQRAVALGADGIVVSNHGGRQLDGARASLDALPEVVAAVSDDVEVLLDGGVRRGTDVVKALALGARAVLIGRPYVYGLAVGGEAGVSAVLEILRAELDRTLTLMGVADVAELDPSWVLPRHEAAGAAITA